MAPRQSRKHSGSITVCLADMGRTLPHLCPTPLPSQSLASRMASRPPPPPYEERLESVSEAPPKFVPRDDVRILPHPPRNRQQSTLDTDLGPRLSGETLAELWDAPIEETLPDSKLAKEIIAARSSPAFSPKMGHVRILARPHSNTDSTSHSPPVSSGTKSPIPEASPKESSAPQVAEPSPATAAAAAPETTTASSDASLRDSDGSRVVSSRKLPVNKLKSDRHRQRRPQEYEDTKTSYGKPRRKGKGKGGKGGGGGRYYRNYNDQWHYNSYYYYY